MYRTENALKALMNYDGSDEENVIDLLTDLRHLCKNLKLDYEFLSDVAAIHFYFENGGQRK
jgi:hypothetical protein